MNYFKNNTIKIQNILIFFAFFFVTLESFYSKSFSINFFYILSLSIFFIIFIFEFKKIKLQIFIDYIQIFIYFFFLFTISIISSYFYNFEILNLFYLKYVFVLLMSFLYFYFLKKTCLKKILFFIIFIHFFFFYAQFLIFYFFNIKLNFLDLFWGIESVGFHHAYNYSTNFFEKIDSIIFLFKNNFIYDLSEEGRFQLSAFRANASLPRFTGIYDEAGTFICMMIILSSLLIFQTQNLNNKIFFLSIVLIITTLIAASIRGYLMLIPFVFLLFIKFNFKEYKLVFSKYKIPLIFLAFFLIIYLIIYIFPHIYGKLVLVPVANKFPLYIKALQDYFTVASSDYYYLFFGTGLSNQLFSFEYTSLTKDTSLMLILLSRFGLISFLLLIFFIYKNNKNRFLECLLLLLIIMLGKFYFYNPIIILILTILMMKNDREIKN